MNGITRSSSITLSLFLTLFLSYGYFFQSGEHNEASRLDLTRALVDDRVLTIDKYAWNTADGISVNGHYYSGKAPGLSLFAVPHWFLFTRAAKMLFSSQVAEHVACYLTFLFTVSITSALFGVLLFNILRKMLKDDSLALIATFAYALGTIAFPFSTLFFSHQFSAVLVGAAFGILYFLKLGHCSNTKKAWLWLGTSGLLAGYAVTTEYPLALAGPPLALYAWHAGRSWRALVPFALGAALSLSVLLIYNQLAFGKLFFITYSAYLGDPHTGFTGHKQGFLGIALPSLRVLYQITFEAQRGIFMCNPWLILVIPALFTPLFIKEHRVELIFSALMVITFFIFNASFTEGIIYSGGGASVGPRHVIPMLPFATILVASWVQHLRFSRCVFYPLVFLSIAIMLMATATEPRAGYEHTNPVVDLFWSHYLRALFSTNQDGLFSRELLTSNSVSFNLAKLAGISGPLQIIPLLLCWIAMLWRFCRRNVLSAATAAVSTIMLLIFAFIPEGYALRNAWQYQSSQGLVGNYMKKSFPLDCSPSFVQTEPTPEELLYKRVDTNFVFDWERSPIGAIPLLVEWDGFVNIPEGGEYKFTVRSDDSACLYLNQNLVVNNGGMHLPETAQGSVFLGKGKNRISIRYINAQGGSAFELHWSPPSGEIDSKFLSPRDPAISVPVVVAPK